MDLYTIGFAKRSAESFFGTLGAAQVRRVIDVRLKNDSQLAGFTRKRDLPYFLKRLVGADYVHELLLAPTERLLDDYRKHQLPWPEYEFAFLNLLKERRVEESLPPELLVDRSVLLCTEPGPEKCHRRLVGEYLKAVWDDIHIHHL